MSETVEINAAQVLAEVFRQRAQTPENTKIAFDVLKLILNREGFIASDVTEALLPINDRLDSLLSFQQSLTTQLGEIMAKLQDIKAAEQAQSETLARGLGEVTALIASLKSQQADIDAAIAAAVETARAEQNTAFEAALDEIAALQTAQTADLDKLDKLSDSTTPPEEPPVEPEEPPTEPTEPVNP